MRPTLTWESSRVTRHGNENKKGIRVVVEADVSHLNGDSPDVPLAPGGLASLRRQTSALRLPPGTADHRKTPPRYTASELASAKMMMDKLRRGDDLRPQKVTTVRASLEHEDFDSAFKMEIAIERLIDDLEH